MALDIRILFLLNILKQMDKILPNFIYAFILARSRKGLFPVTFHKGLGSRRGEIGPAIEMHSNLKCVYMFYFIEKNLNFICLVLKLCKLWISKDKDPL